MILPCTASTLLSHPRYFTLFSRIDVQDLTRDASTPILTRQKQNALGDGLRRDRLLKPSRSLSIEPVLVWVFCTLFPELHGVYWTRRYRVDSS
jgi:hypothetical protein